MNDITVSIPNVGDISVEFVTGPEIHVKLAGEDGQPGAPGVGVPSGGTTGQVLAKKTDTDYDAEWQTASSGGVQDVQVNGTSVVTSGVANVPVAGASTLGVVSPDAKTSAMTQTVGVDASGKLWTAAGGGGGGSGRTLLGEATMTGGIWMAIQSIDYSTGIITVDDASALPDSSISYVSGRVAVLHKNGFANLKTIPQELIKDTYGITKLSATTVQINGVTSCTQTTDIDLSGWYIYYNANGAASISVSGLEMKNHIQIEFYSRYCSLNSGFGCSVHYSGNNRYRAIDNNYILPSYFGGSLYEFFSTRNTPITNGSVGSGIKGCGLPIYYLIDMIKHDDVCICDCKAWYAVAQNKTSMPRYVNDIVSVLIDNQGLSKIIENGGGDFQAIISGASLKVWEVND